MWDWRFLFLILFSSLVDFTVGLALLNQDDWRKRKLLLWASIFINLGILGVFKYYNFFVQNFVDAFSFFGKEIEIRSINIILPVGISFYTFQTLSYGFDVYKKKLIPTKSFIDFSAFVSFFPQLVAGPIERATHLLPQFYKKRTFNYELASDGLRQMLWGFFKKIVIADNCANLANQFFDNYTEYPGSALFLGALFFTFQIYGDFSGYSDIATGCARLFGFDLMQNFNFPYFSRDIAEFWRRWHISLSTWFRDYLYIPLGGSKGSLWMKIRNTFIIFIVSGFWHGANWTFITWGALNALYFLPLLLTQRNRINLDGIAQGKLIPKFKDFIAMLFTFILTVIAWIFFRSQSMHQAIEILNRIFSASLFSNPQLMDVRHTYLVMFLILVFIVFEWLGREGKYGFSFVMKLKQKWMRWGFYCFLLLIIYLYGYQGEAIEFIYFQF
jgi:D-alanyl-lipoteichoic acid acyltransferase DltB (MBOAT superfamily)